MVILVVSVTVLYFILSIYLQYYMYNDGYRLGKLMGRTEAEVEFTERYPAAHMSFYETLSKQCGNVNLARVALADQIVKQVVGEDVEGFLSERSCSAHIGGNAFKELQLNVAEYYNCQTEAYEPIPEEA